MSDNRRYSGGEQSQAARQRQARFAQAKNEAKKLKSERSKRWQVLKWPILVAAFSLYLIFMMTEARQIQNFEEAYATRAISQVMMRYGASDGVAVPNRGIISDRNMQPLAVSSINYNIFADAILINGWAKDELCPVEERCTQCAIFRSQRYILTEFFGMNDTEFAHMLTQNTNQYFLERNVPFSRRMEFEAWIAENNLVPRHIHFEELTQRTYIHNNVAAPVIGFNHGEWWGIESRFNRYLAGSEGRNLTIFGADGHIATDRIPAQQGAHIVTTLDIAIQRFAEDLVVDWAKQASAGFASAIVMNPHNGEIFAMAQYPGFDANQPSNAELLIAQNAEYLSSLDPASQEFFDNLYGIWANFNVSTTHEPGSIYKSITTAKALDAGVITPNQMFYCTGFKEVAGHRIRCWIYPRRHGQINLTEALAHSCNVAHMEIAEALGRDLFWQYQRDFGFGVPTGIDLPAENAGLVHTIAGLNASELATASFGQRFTATPIQTISSFAPLINGGNIIRPHIVSHILDADNVPIFTQNTAIQRRVIAPDVADWMRHAMGYTVTEGTGRNATIAGFTQGGKTATGEQGINDEDNEDFSWAISYVGYFPIDNPQYLVMVLLHEIPPEVYDNGFRSVVPMYRDMMQHIINIRNMPQNTMTALAGGLVEDEQAIVDFVGMGVQQAISTLNVLGFNYRFVGSGDTVVSQFPPANARLSNGEIEMVINLADNGKEPLIPVPNVVGLPIDSANAILTASGFVPRVRFVGDDETLHEYAGTADFVVQTQIGGGLSIPANTDILLMAIRRN